MTLDRVTVSAIKRRQWLALAAMLVGIVLCAATPLRFSYSSEPDQAPREALERRRSQPEDTPCADDSPAVVETPQSPVPTVPIHRRSLAELRDGLQAIANEERKLSTTGIERERQSALLRLRMYRFLCRLPQDDLTLEAQLNDDAFAVADICRRVGKLSHAPDNPGLPDDEYQHARAAAGKCNLSFGISDLTKAIDLWMNDSDAHNIGHLGHRRWCLNPKLFKLGLDRSDEFCAMWAFDTSRTPAPQYEFVSFPPPGFVPVDLFSSEYAWSITLNPGKYLAPDLEAITVEVFPICEDKVDREHPLEIEHLAVDLQGFGVNNCVIFRPKSLKVLPFESYQLALSGLHTIDGKPTHLTFVVRFVEAISPTTPTDATSCDKAR